MKFSIPTNWQKDLIPQVRKEGVVELYGKLTSDFIGGVRPSFILPYVGKRAAFNYIKKTHQNNLRFNYLLNALCLDNKEFTISGQRKIHNLLDWLGNCKVDYLTVAIPYLLQLIKRQYPQFKMVVSVVAGVASPERAKYWEDLGADRITLFSPDLNRNFKLLKMIRKRVKCELQLIANLGTLYNCPFHIYHSLIISHASQSEHVSAGFNIDYCILNCRIRRLDDLVNFIRSDWIRPEDIHYYEEVGIDMIKLVDRTAPTEQISLVTNAYLDRNYKGNLADLILPWSQKKAVRKPLFTFLLRYLRNPFRINIFKVIKLQKLIKGLDVYIDNQELDGFLEYFLEGKCDFNCGECGYCEQVSNKVVKINQEYRKKTIKQYKDFLDKLL